MGATWSATVIRCRASTVCVCCKSEPRACVTLSHIRAIKTQIYAVFPASSVALRLLNLMDSECAALLTALQPMVPDSRALNVKDP